MKKKILTRLLAALLCGLMLISLWGCQPENENPNGEDTGTDSKTESNGDQAPAEEPLFDVAEVFKAEALSDAVIVYDKDNATNNLSELIFTMQFTLQDLFGVKVPIRNHTTESSAKYEIVVGSTSRASSLELQQQLRANDWGYGVRGNTLLISGSKTENVVKAVESFNTYLGTLQKGTDTVLSNANACMNVGEYAVTLATLNGVNLNKYVIVYPETNRNNARLAAQKLQEMLIEKTGYALYLTSDSKAKSDYEILVGETTRDVSDLTLTTPEGDACGITGKDGKVWLTGASYVGVVDAVMSFMDYYVGDSGNVTVEINGEQNLDESTLIKVLSHNIYNDSGELNNSNTAARPYRIKMIVEEVQEVHPDVFLCQEPTDWWMVALMQGLGDEYTWSYTLSNGKDSDESNMAIFYRHDKLELLDKGMFWLSDTPNFYSWYTGSWCPRIVTWAKFEVKATGKQFMAVNVHLDGSVKVPDFHDMSINSLQGQILADFVKKHQDTPIVLAGDFNRRRTDTNGETTPYQMLTTDNLLYDVPTVSWNGNKTASIDYTYVSKGMQVVNFQILETKTTTVASNLINITAAQWGETGCMEKLSDGSVRIKASDHQAQVSVIYLE